MAPVGYISYDPRTPSVEPRWVAAAFGCEVQTLSGAPSLNLRDAASLCTLDEALDAARPILPLRAVVIEGPAGFLWGSVLRLGGYSGAIAFLPYLNPSRWYDVLCASVYTRFADRRDRIFVGSTPSARIYRGLGIDAEVAEPYGIDGERFFPRPGARSVLDELGIPRGRMLLFAGRAQPDKDLHLLLRVGLKARILFPHLEIVVASHVLDEEYVGVLRRELGASSGIHLVERPNADQLARLYNAADVFATASTSHFETFGRSPAEALACGTPAIAPRYDGFAEVLAQPGGTLVNLDLSGALPHVREEEMLRAIYDVLSGTGATARDEIARTARRRFDRRVTIRHLEHVVSDSEGAPREGSLAATDVPLPGVWTDALHRMARMTAEDSIDFAFHVREQEGASALDAEFRNTIREKLATLALSEEVSSSCP